MLRKRTMKWGNFIGMAAILLLALSSATGAQSVMNLSIHEKNPVLSAGPGSWESGLVFLPHVIFHDGTFYMFYSGAIGSPWDAHQVAIGVATSTDGLNWTKYDSNPILKGDGSGFDGYNAAEGTPVVRGGLWSLYYDGRQCRTCSLRPREIGRATASRPFGPWRQATDPVLRAGDSGSWDNGWITPNSVIATEQGYVMYYSGGSGSFPQKPSIGMATSVDGIKWEKFNDPNTKDDLLVQSDPVLSPGPAGSWDAGGVWFGSVLKTERGWEMFYTGGTQTPRKWSIGYATSDDGIHWTKFSGNPVQVPGNDRWAQDNTMESTTVIFKDSTYYVYYDYGLTVGVGAIGLAIGNRR